MCIVIHYVSTHIFKLKIYILSSKSKNIKHKTSRSKDPNNWYNLNWCLFAFYHVRQMQSTFNLFLWQYIPIETLCKVSRASWSCEWHNISINNDENMHIIFYWNSSGTLLLSLLIVNINVKSTTFRAVTRTIIFLPILLFCLPLTFRGHTILICKYVCTFICKFYLFMNCAQNFKSHKTVFFIFVHPTHNLSFS